MSVSFVMTFYNWAEDNSGVDPGGGDRDIGDNHPLPPPNKKYRARVSFYLNTRIYPVEIALPKNELGLTLLKDNSVKKIARNEK